MDALIAGAGLGGLVTALKLNRMGMKVRVVDAARQLLPLGVGINLLPHGAAVLYELGLGEKLEATGIQTRAIEYRTQFGQLIYSDPRGRNAGSPWPQFSIHRGHLHKVLLDAALEELPEGSIVTGHRALGFTQLNGRVRLNTQRADGAAVEFEGDFLIGADGVHSALCRQLHPDVSPLKFSGTMIWRGAIEREPFLDGQTMVIAGHHDSKVVIYPISEQARRQGKSLINMTAELNIGAGATYPKEDWNREAGVSEFIAAFESWKFDFLDIPETFRQTKNIFVYPMVDRDPLPLWSKGNVTLLGDAAHPMYPIGANGASQAFLDVDALTRAIEEAGKHNITEAFQMYESNRLPATAAVIASNRAKGPEAVLQLARERVKSADDDVNALITREEIDAITQGYQKVAGFDLGTLQGRAAGAARQP